MQLANDAYILGQTMTLAKIEARSIPQMLETEVLVVLTIDTVPMEYA